MSLLAGARRVLRVRTAALVSRLYLPYLLCLGRFCTAVRARLDFASTRDHGRVQCTDADQRTYECTTAVYVQPLAAAAADP